MSIIKSDNDKGNPYHSGETGQFVSAYGDATSSKEKTLPISSNAKIKIEKDFLPKDKDFFIDFNSPEQKEKIKLNEKKYFDRFGQKMLKIDYNFEHYNTMKKARENPERLIEDKKKVEKYLDEQVREKGIPANRECTFFLGLPGAGKSYFVKNSDQKFLEADADIFKDMIPEFQQDEDMVSAVHNESVFMFNHFQEEAMKKGLNIAIGKVGGDSRQIEKSVKQMIAAGYNVKIKAILVSQSTAVDRAINRYDRGTTRRVVPFDVFNSSNGIIETLNRAMNEGWASEIEIYDNDIPRGSEPILLNKGKTNNSIKFSNFKKSLEEDKAKKMFNLK